MQSSTESGISSQAILASALLALLTSLYVYNKFNKMDDNNKKEEEKKDDQQERSAFEEVEDGAEWEDQDAESGEEEAELEGAEESEEEDDGLDPENKELEAKEGELGCKHYRRACQLRCPDDICKGAFYPCRLCHDEVHHEAEMNPKKNHQLERKKVTFVKCLRCQKEQPKGKTCSDCGKDFAKYYCDICSLYDDMGEQKGVYHCEKCGICRVGGADKFFHCDNCGCCLSKLM